MSRTPRVATRHPGSIRRIFLLRAKRYGGRGSRFTHGDKFGVPQNTSGRPLSIFDFGFDFRGGARCLEQCGVWSGECRVHNGSGTFINSGCRMSPDAVHSANFISASSCGRSQTVVGHFFGGDALFGKCGVQSAEFEVKDLSGGWRRGTFRW